MVTADLDTSEPLAERLRRCDGDTGPQRALLASQGGAATPTTNPTTPTNITRAVVASFERCESERLRLIMVSLATHLHAFATEVELTQAEWEAGIRILTETGQITNDRRQEFILWSDALGVSMLVDALAHSAQHGATESTVLGPFYVPGAELREFGASIAEEAAGEPAWVHGYVRDVHGEPIAGAELDVWQNGDDRLYAVQSPDAPEHHLRGRFSPRDDGSYAFLAVRPGALHNSRQRPRRTDAGLDRPAPMAPCPHSLDRPRTRLPHRGDAYLRRWKRVPRLGRRIRGQTVIAA